ncbi:hypothetical protein AB0F91_28730 [Amycolatopsis sp. NPDC023774]|uniref:hypothetical protein n=1 Tax=Amycolatopsis sp. NPDC023774 TaxID=3155015 RepID=UPI003408B24A
MKVAEQTTDRVLRIEATAKNQVLGASGSIEVTVQLPAGSRVSASAASADFRGVGRSGEATFEGSTARSRSTRRPACGCPLKPVTPPSAG